jgi:hypothetical protein
MPWSWVEDSSFVYETRTSSLDRKTGAAIDTFGTNSIKSSDLVVK